VEIPTTNELIKLICVHHGDETTPPWEVGKIGPLIIVRVGSDARPASDEDINDVMMAFDEVLQDPTKKCIVTHHAVDVEFVGRCTRCPFCPPEESESAAAQASICSEGLEW
jgi:hypothetical protein